VGILVEFFKLLKIFTFGTFETRIIMADQFRHLHFQNGFSGNRGTSKNAGFF